MNTDFNKKLDRLEKRYLLLLGLISGIVIGIVAAYAIMYAVGILKTPIL